MAFWAIIAWTQKILLKALIVIAYSLDFTTITSQSEHFSIQSLIYWKVMILEWFDDGNGTICRVVEMVL